MAQRLLRRKWMVPAIIALVGAGLFVVVWFEPQKLVVDERVSETLPEVESEASGESESETDPQPQKELEFQTLAKGDFKPLAHAAEGKALVIEAPSGDVYLRFVDFEVENGPDLRVYLSAASSGSPEEELGAEFIDLGELKGNLGNQNYRIPKGTDLDGYRSAVVWCRRFAVGFAVADLR